MSASTDQETPTATPSSTAAAAATASTTTTTTTTAPMKEDWEIQRDHHKQDGDQAFRMGGFKTAIDHYSKAIALDPEFVLAYSNRSAAHLKNSEKSKALRDAEQVIKLDSDLPKGHSRLAAALHSLRRYDHAKAAYQKVLELDAQNAVARKGVADCQAELDKRKEQQQQFEEQQQQEQQKEEEAAKKQPIEETPAAAAAKGEEDGDEDGDGDGDGEDDDSLDDFFADVEEVAAKPKEEPEAPKATNVIKKDKQVLGTVNEQMDRLLRPNNEWWNLNPYYVLQLSHTATDDDVARRYKALSLMLHPDKNGGIERAQFSFDLVKKAKTVLMEPDRAKHTRLLIEEGIKQADILFHKQTTKPRKKMEELRETEVMRIFAQIEHKRREVEGRERKYEQRTQQQEDDQDEKERQERRFDKSWRKEERVDNRVGNWRDFAGGPKKKKKKVK